MKKTRNGKQTAAVLALYAVLVLTALIAEMVVFRPDAREILLISAAMGLLLFIGYDLGHTKRQRKTFARGYRRGAEDIGEVYHKIYSYKPPRKHTEVKLYKLGQ